jgi:hypothetical protein
MWNGTPHFSQGFEYPPITRFAPPLAGVGSGRWVAVPGVTSAVSDGTAIADSEGDANGDVDGDSVGEAAAGGERVASGLG